MRQFEIKGYLEERDYVVILAMVALPLLLLVTRVSAMPGSPLGALPGIASLGGWLDSNLTLAWIPAEDRHKVLYLLVLPAAGLLITLSRLTFGLRVLGFRSILIGVAFHEIGIFSSLVVMASVIGIIVLLRPWMRRMRLPMYARLSLILGLTACMQILALLGGTWERSDLVWNFAFFPVIILAMMAESIAGTLDSDSPASAAWRLAWTLVVALLLAGLMASQGFLELMLSAPELLLIQLAAIILVAEHADFRLLQDWQTTARQWLQRTPLVYRRRRVAVVVNRSAHGTISRRRAETAGGQRQESIQHVVDALRSDGYLVRVFEGDMQLLRELGKFLAPHPRTGAPGGVVLNLSQGIQGKGRQCHVPAMLEMAGVAYTGPDPVGHALRSDRILLLRRLQDAGLNVPAHWALDPAQDVFPALDFPLRVRMRHGDGSFRLVRSGAELSALLSGGLETDAQELVAEELPPGDDFQIGVLGHERLECLPPVRVDNRGRPRPSPASLEPEVSQALRDAARRAFRASGCRDFARIDLRVGAQGEVWVVDVVLQGLLGRSGSVAQMVAESGMGWGGLLRHVIELAAKRSHVEWTDKDPAMPLLSQAAPDPAAPLQERQA